MCFESHFPNHFIPFVREIIKEVWWNKEKETNVLFNFEIKTKFNFYDIEYFEASSLCNPKRYQYILIQLKINTIKKRLKKSIFRKKNKIVQEKWSDEKPCNFIICWLPVSLHLFSTIRKKETKNNKPDSVTSVNICVKYIWFYAFQTHENARLNIEM